VTSVTSSHFCVSVAQLDIKVSEYLFDLHPVCHVQYHCSGYGGCEPTDATTM